MLAAAHRFDQLWMESKVNLYKELASAHYNIHSLVSSGDFDIPSKPQKTCMWQLTRFSKGGGGAISVCPIMRYENNLKFLSEYKYCPYCSKPIEIIEDE